MRGLLTGRTVLLAGPLDDISNLIALPLAAAGAAIIFAGPHDHNNRQLAVDIHKAGGIASFLGFDGDDLVTSAGTVDLTIKIGHLHEDVGSATDHNKDELTARTIVEQRLETTIEVCPSPPLDGEISPLRWTLQRPATLARAGADPTVAQVSDARASAPAPVAGEILRWAFEALLPSEAAAIPTLPAPAGEIRWDEEARADEDLNFELA